MAGHLGLGGHTSAQSWDKVVTSVWGLIYLFWEKEEESNKPDSSSSGGHGLPQAHHTLGFLSSEIMGQGRGSSQIQKAARARGSDGVGAYPNLHSLASSLCPLSLTFPRPFDPARGIFVNESGRAPCTCKPLQGSPLPQDGAGTLHLVLQGRAGLPLPTHPPASPHRPSLHLSVLRGADS